MLSPASLAMVRQTLPAVAAVIPDITTLFYEKLFADHPELLDNLFSRGNQATGAQHRRSPALSARFATLVVENPDQDPAPVLARISHRHASLGITPDQYEIVHTYLFAAIGDVLGPAVTPAVAAAWDELYWFMARTLIGLEAGLYRDAGREPGPNWEQWRVVARYEESEDAASFVLHPEGDTVASPFQPGQYVSVAVTLPDGARQIRQYSLSSAPRWATRRITLKRVRTGAGPDGEVSGWLHGNVAAGDVLTLSPPYGNVVVDGGSSPLLLASAGIGCTPITGILDHLVATGSLRHVTVVHTDRSVATHALRRPLYHRVSRLVNAQARIWYEEPHPGWPAAYTGFVDLSKVEITADMRAYICGPAPFIESIRRQLLDRGVPATAIRHELFGPELAA